MNTALNPHSCFSLYRRTDCGDFCIVDVLKGMSTNHFPFVGTHFKTDWDCKGTAGSFTSGLPIGVKTPCWQGNPKGTAFPWQWFPKAAALPWQEESKGRQSLPGGKNPMKPAVSWHTTLPAKSSVLYLWRPWVAERGCSGQEQALSVSHRTGGFWRATR